MLIFNQLGGADDRVLGEVALAFEWRQKSRMRVTLDSGLAAGQVVGVDLPRGTVLREGALISTSDGASVRIRSAAEALLHVTAAEPVALSRIAYHLGNRHVPVQVGQAWLRLQYDHVLEGMVLGLGGVITVIEEGFEPESGAYGHGRHSHGTGHGHAHGPGHPQGEGVAAALAHDHAVPGSIAGRHDDARHAPRIHDFLSDPPGERGA